ncbi:MAG: ribosome maturation factor RimM [Bdellovibrionaceae bacterium]|nr:ribosome maturation factor RimM [Pseudobdellovibrionaceae bacterium]
MLVCIGKIVDAHGLKGEVKVRFISEDPEWIEDLFRLYIHPEESGSFLNAAVSSSEIYAADEKLKTHNGQKDKGVPATDTSLPVYDVEEVRYTNQLWILKLSDVHDRTQAEALKNHFVFVTQDFFKTSDQEAPYLLELKGYQVEVQGQECGEVVGFLETPAHSLILLKTLSGEYEIPWVSDFIGEIDREQKIIKMTFPLDLLSEDFNTKK